MTTKTGSTEHIKSNKLIHEQVADSKDIFFQLLILFVFINKSFDPDKSLSYC